MSVSKSESNRVAAIAVKTSKEGEGAESHEHGWVGVENVAELGHAGAGVRSLTVAGERFRMARL